MTRHSPHGRRKSWFGALVTTLAAMTVFTGTPAHAMDDQQWRELARCESGGNPSINTGNGFYGLYQFDHGTWLSNGGGKYGDNAHEATAAQQTEIAERLYAARGASPWPACARKLGLLKKANEQKAKPAPGASQERQAGRAQVTNPAHYVVALGDTLSGIAERLDLPGGWQPLFERNREVITVPHLIFPGQHLAVS